MINQAWGVRTADLISIIYLQPSRQMDIDIEKR